LIVDRQELLARFSLIISSSSWNDGLEIVVDNSYLFLEYAVQTESNQKDTPSLVQLPWAVSLHFKTCLRLAGPIPTNHRPAQRVVFLLSGADEKKNY
jgi:hypothetical protein